jgi:hypothetical protein
VNTSTVVIVIIIALVIYFIYNRGKKQGRISQQFEAKNEIQINQMLGNRATKPYVFPYALEAWEKTKDITTWNSLIDEYIKKIDFITNSDKAMPSLVWPYWSYEFDPFFKIHIEVLQKWDSLTLNNMDFNGKLQSDEETKWLITCVILQTVFQQMLMGIELGKLRSGQPIIITEIFDTENKRHLENLFSDLIQKKDNINSVTLLYFSRVSDNLLKIQATRSIAKEDIILQTKLIHDFLQK